MVDKPLMALRDIVKTYSLEGVQSQILKKISLNIYEGELLAIVGASGSGKSTLMNILGLLDKADSGTYLLNNKNVAYLADEDMASLRNQTIGFVFQQFNLLPRFNALQNVALPLIYRGMSAKESEEEAIKALKKVAMDSYVKHKPMQLSGGQQQRVAIARALVTNPQVILADEPTGALDSRIGGEVMSLFLALHEEGRTLILITHDEQIAKLCPRRISIADGVIVSDSAS